jgi:hypothetical protein
MTFGFQSLLGIIGVSILVLFASLIARGNGDLPGIVHLPYNGPCHITGFTTPPTAKDERIDVLNCHKGKDKRTYSIKDSDISGSLDIKLYAPTWVNCKITAKGIARCDPRPITSTVFPKE